MRLQSLLGCFFQKSLLALLGALASLLIALLLLLPVAAMGDVVPPPVFSWHIIDNATGGDCGAIGSWDAAARTCRLTRDLTLKSGTDAGISVDADNIFLEGNGHSLDGGAGKGSLTGVAVMGRQDTIQHLNVSNFTWGFQVESTGDALALNTVTGSGIGIMLQGSGEVISANTITAGAVGINLSYSGNNILNANTMSGNTSNFNIMGFNDNDFQQQIDTSNTVDGRPLYYVINAANRTFDASTNAGAFYCVDCSNIIVSGLNVSGNDTGIYLRNCSDSKVENVVAANDNIGIQLDHATNIDLTSNVASGNREKGIALISVSGSRLSGNVASADNDQVGWGQGIFVDAFSSGNLLQGNIVNSNDTGIGLFGPGNSLDGNFAEANANGIAVWSPQNTISGNHAGYNTKSGMMIEDGPNTLRDNSMAGNPVNFSLEAGSAGGYENDIDTSNTLDGKPIYYVKDATGTTYGPETNAGTFYCIHCDGVTVSGLNLSHDGDGVFLFGTVNSRVDGLNISGSSVGVRLEQSDNDTVSGNTVSGSGYCGVTLNASSGDTLTGNVVTASSAHDLYLFNSGAAHITGNTLTKSSADGILAVSSPAVELKNNLIDSSADSGMELSASGNSTITGNTISKSAQGLALNGSGGNTVYGNNFIDNKVQVTGAAGSDAFNLPAPAGGNFWSDWTGPDADSDGFIDLPYKATGGNPDYLPRVHPVAVQTAPLLYLAHGAPAAYWSSYEDYLSRRLSVTWMVANLSSAPLDNAEISESINSGDVSVLTPLPALMGTINPGEIAESTLVYQVPPGISKWASLTLAQCQDGSGATYTFTLR